jgi:hypothetical protein
VRCGRVAPGLLAALLLAACGDSDAVGPPGGPSAAETLFERYVALGQSNTAGFMSGGINVNTQRAAYPVLLAERAAATFHVPALAMPGCPPPLTAALPSQQREGGGTAATCALRETPPPPFVSNLAVPGARILDMVDNQAPGSRTNALTSLILGERTQLEAMMAAQPTLVSVWPEGNDALGAVVTGDPRDVTPPAEFVAALDRIVAGIRQMQARALLIGVIDVTLTPALQPGAFFHALQLTGLSPKPVMASCAPGAPGASLLVSTAVLYDPRAEAVHCAPEAPGVLGEAELEQLRATIAGYNATIEARARANGWAYLDPNPGLRQAAENPVLVRRCQGLAGAGTSSLALLQAFQATCPGPHAPHLWGAYLSLDPIHLSVEGHRFIHDLVAAELNRHFGVSLPLATSSWLQRH